LRRRRWRARMLTLVQAGAAGLSTFDMTFLSSLKQLTRYFGTNTA
jgi:hypothetical protein